VPSRHRFVVVSVLVLLGTPVSSVFARAERPNILLFLADDLGCETLGCYGGTSYRTPHLDALARDGLRFRHAYSMAVCHPTRVCLMTGRYPFRLGNPRWGSFPRAAETQTFAHAMKAVGYATAVAGKWQLALLGKDRGQPYRLGFDEFCLFGWHEGARYWDPWIWQNGVRRRDVGDRYGPDVYTEFLIDFMSRHREQPFVAFYSMALCHDVTDDLKEPVPFKPGKDRYESYTEMVEAMDERVGRLVAALERLDLRRDTLVLFIGDNGTPSRSILHVRDGKLVRESVSSRMGDVVIPGGKGKLTDGGTHVPLIASWPARITTGRVTDALVDMSDFLPTFADLGAAAMPQGVDIDGRSFAPVLTGAKKTTRDWAFAEHGGRWWVRTEQWKLYGDGRLFDIANDDTERRAVAVDGQSAEAAAAREHLAAVAQEIERNHRQLADHRALQWNDFGKRTVRFGGHRWRVKGKEPCRYGPRSNWFSDAAETVRVDGKGRLHLGVSKRDGKWSCAEIATEDALGYGEYAFQLRGRVGRLDPNLILGLFLWEYQSTYDGLDERNVANEFDIEIGSWKGRESKRPAQFVCQPWAKKGNLHRFDPRMPSDDEAMTVAFRWEPDRVRCRAWRGHDREPAVEELITSWDYTGSDVPTGEPRMHINLWLLEPAPSDEKDHEVVIDGFRFTPLGSRDVVPRVEVEEDVYRPRGANNGSGPMWCFGSTCIARVGDTVYASGIEVIPDAKPLNNTLPVLFRRDPNGWRKMYNHRGRTREPSPLAAFRDGRLFLSINPTLTEPDTYGGPARPRVVELDEDARTGRFLDPVWDGKPPFTEHSYRSFAADGEAGELILLQNIGYGHAEWSFLDRDSKWSAQGKILWPGSAPSGKNWGAEYDKPQPIRVCYPTVALKDRAVWFCGVSDIVEPYDAWRRYKRELTGRKWDYDFRRLFFTWSDDIATGKFEEWVEVSSRDKTAGHIFPCDLHVARNGDVFVLWYERAIDERLRAKFFPQAKQRYSLEYAILRRGEIVRRTALVEGGEAVEGPGGLRPGRGRFHVMPDGRLLVVYHVGGTNRDGKGISENRIVEIFPDGRHGEAVTVPLEKPLTAFFTATPRAGCAPSDVIDLFGQIGDAMRYVRVRLR